jgi:peptide/nickel transport system permease protein
MPRFLIKRALRAALSLYLFVTFVFFFAQVVLPTDFTTQFAMFMTRSEREALQHELGLDLPLWQRYVDWLGKLVTGDLGVSYYGYSVTDQLRDVLPPTLLIFCVGTLIAFVLGQWLGKYAAWRGKGPLSGATTFTAIALYTSFPPWLAFLMIYFFVQRFHLFPQLLLLYDNPFGELRRRQAAHFGLQPQTAIMYVLLTLIVSLLVWELLSRALERRWRRQLSMHVLAILAVATAAASWYAFGFGEQAVEILHLAALPIVTYVLLSTGETMLIMQTTMKDTLREEYVTAARARGLPDHVVRDKHAARNAVIPVFSRLVVSLPYLLTGIVIIERAVNWPGMGETMLLALYNQDMPIVMGGLLLIGVVSMLARLVLEAAQLYIDPRLRDRTLRPADLRLQEW